MSQASKIFETAAEHASLKVPVAALHQTAGQVRQALLGQRYDTISLIVVCRQNVFLGVIRIEDLLAASEAATVEELIDRQAPIVASGIDQEIAAWQAVQHKESALSVVDDAGRFVGVIPPHKLIAVLLKEHEEDLSHAGGFWKAADNARAASTEPVRRRFWHRVPWLIIGLAGIFVAADFVSLFESQLRHKLILAFFIPGIVYIADAVGTQTETVVVRGLSVGIAMKQMITRELFSGLAIGMSLGAIAGPMVWLRWGDSSVALCIGLSVFAASSTASLVAMLLPWLLGKLRFDPAFGSGPLTTVIQDLLSILIYFAIANAIVR